MRVYENKEELKTEINKTFEKYIAEFDNIPESLKDKRIDEVDRTPAENLAYHVVSSFLPILHGFDFGFAWRYSPRIAFNLLNKSTTYT